MVELIRQDGTPILINPVNVAAVFASASSEYGGEGSACTVVRLSDGRGFLIQGDFESVKARLGFSLHQN